MKGIAESTIVRIIIALIVLGVIVTVLYLGLGPFRSSVEYNSCVAYLRQYCIQNDEESVSNLLRNNPGPCEKIGDRHPYYNKLRELVNKKCKEL